MTKRNNKKKWTLEKAIDRFVNKRCGFKEPSSGVHLVGVGTTVYVKGGKIFVRVGHVSGRGNNIYTMEVTKVFTC